MLACRLFNGEGRTGTCASGSPNPKTLGIRCCRNLLASVERNYVPRIGTGKKLPKATRLKCSSYRSPDCNRMWGRMGSGLRGDESTKTYGQVLLVSCPQALGTPEALGPNSNESAMRKRTDAHLYKALCQRSQSSIRIWQLTSHVATHHSNNASYRREVNHISRNTV